MFFVAIDDDNHDVDLNLARCNAISLLPTEADGRGLGTNRREQVPEGGASSISLYPLLFFFPPNICAIDNKSATG